MDQGWEILNSPALLSSALAKLAGSRLSSAARQAIQIVRG